MPSRVKIRREGRTRNRGSNAATQRPRASLPSPGTLCWHALSAEHRDGAVCNTSGKEGAAEHSHLEGGDEEGAKAGSARGAAARTLQASTSGVLSLLLLLPHNDVLVVVGRPGGVLFVVVQ